MSAWVVASSIVSPLGFTSAENYARVRAKVSGLSRFNDRTLSERPLVAARLAGLEPVADLTRFESMCARAVEEAIVIHSPDPQRTLFILSTTKGNIAQLSEVVGNYHSLHETAKRLARRFGYPHSLVVSNACISGVMAIIAAKRFLSSGKYDHAIIIGADELSQFVVSGFESLHALSDTPCRPFDAARNGINLGEAAAAIVLTTQQPDGTLIRITGGGLSNDANHISGPSRTGTELAMAVRQALNESGHSASDVDFISAHGTATIFNDEMEAKAFSQLGMDQVPLHSLKGYFGHTLGAAGVVETVMCIEGLLHDEVPATLGYESPGVSTALNVSAHLRKQVNHICLKTASGFGGCNAAIVIEKDN